ncbi:tyrosine-protein phosphatase non-receptor type 13-like isoform X2 [Oculina patagonica]
MNSATVIGEGDKLINVVLLNGERLNVRVQGSATGQDLYSIITDHLGLTETIFFGLMIIKDGEHEFLDLNEKLSKLAKFAPHLWKDDVSCNSSLVFTIFFRVKYYVENICLLQQQSTRHLYYLQLRKDVLEGGIYVHEETSMLLASYALQAEVGDYNQTLHGSDYFVPEHYLPQRAIAKLTASYIKKHLPSMHKTHTGLSDAQAEIEYLKEAQKLQEYGIIFNKVSKYKKDKRGGFSLGISVRGLIVYEERGIVKSPTFRHPWQNIKRMAFHRRRFFIEAHGDPETSKMVLYTCSYKKSRYLLKMCTSFYKFQMMMGMKLSSLKEYPKDGVVRMNGVVKTDESDSLAGDMPELAAGKPGHDSSVIQPSGIGPAIHLNGSACPVQEDQPVQVSVHPVQLQKVNGSLGLNIIGGIELGGIYVKTMAPEGPASLSGKINIGDRILEINGHSLEGLSRQEAVNILRTAPHVCTMLIESCVAAPATPNGKPVMPGSESASAFYHPNRQQQMQPMMQRHPSLESQYSSMQQQFVPSQSHQIEDIVAVSTPKIEKPKPETMLPLGKQSSIEAIAWVQPFDKGAVSAIIKERAMSKVTVVNENDSPEESPEKCKEPVDTLGSLLMGGEISKGDQASGNFQEQSDASWEENKTIPHDQGDISAADDDSKLLSSTEQQALQNEESNVVGFFKRIQSFLFSPSSSKPKRSEESESSCCESDFDSEFSEMTQGSFNPGDIETIRDELETLLSGSPTRGLETGDEFFYGEPSSSQQRISLPLEKDVVTTDSNDKCMLEMEEIKTDKKEEKNAKKLDDNSYLKGREERAVGSGKITADNQKMSPEIKQIENEGIINSKFEEVVSGTQETTSDKGNEFNKKTGEVDESFKDDTGKKESERDADDSEPLIYRTTSVAKFKKETTV